MSDKVVLSRSNPSMMADEEGARRDFSGGGLVLPHEKPFRTFRSWGRDYFATPDNPRPKGDAWRLRWWYHGAVISNHWLSIGTICNRAKSHYVWGVLPLAVSRRWTDRSGERLDFYVQETLPAAHKCNEQPVTLKDKHHAGT